MAEAKSILITGAAGSIGSAAALAFAAAGHQVWKLGRTPIKGFVTCDLTGPFETGLAKFPDLVGNVPDAIVHTAAAVPHDHRYPDTAASADLTRSMDEQVYRAASAWGSRVVYMSGCTLYDRKDPSFKTPESALSEDLTPYLEAKRDGERLFQSLASTIIRVSSPVGPHMKPTVVMKRFVDRSRAGQPIEIWGSGQREQDFVHVNDIASLLIAAFRRRPALTPQIFNCASGQPVAMIELARQVVEIVGQGDIIMTGRSDPAEGETARYSLELTQTEFDWAPAFGLVDMIRAV